MIDDSTKHLFQTEVRDYFHAHGRHDLPCAKTRNSRPDVYHIVVSELMLPTNQVSRVIANITNSWSGSDGPEPGRSSLGRCTAGWNGLGYNRRAKFLWQTARQVVREHDGIFPPHREELIKLPGIGSNTAGAILALCLQSPRRFHRDQYPHRVYPSFFSTIGQALVTRLSGTRN